jgi:membrane-associated protease RseP (regulator of RpoE activity)
MVGTQQKGKEQAMTRTRFCVTVILVALAMVVVRPAQAVVAENRNEVRVEMNAAGPGKKPEVRIEVNGEEVKPGDPVPEGVGRLHAESIADPNAGMGDGKGAKARIHTRIEVEPDQPGGQPRVRMWINGKEVDPGDAIQLDQGKAQLRIETATPPRGREGEPNQAVLGVRIAELPDELAREVGVDAGVAVTGTVPGTPAQHVGLREGDVISAVDGKSVRSPEELVERIGRRRPGEQVRIEWHRGRARLTATVALAARADFVGEEERRDEGREAREREEREAREREERQREERGRDEREREEAEAREREKQGGGFLGVLAAPLNDDIREIAGTDKGVLINSLTDDSPAAKAGLKPGDVIVRIGDANIDGVDQLVEVLGDRKPGDRIHVVYYRMGKRREAEVTLGRRPGEEGEARGPEGMPSFEDLLRGQVPDLREYLERLRPQMRDWARRFQEQRERPEMRPAEPPLVERDFDRLMERLERIERRLDRIEERLERREP